MTLYFAFGSNMDIAQMNARCPSAEVIGAAEFLDHELLFPRFSPRRLCAVAGYRSAPGKSVWGVVYDVSDPDLAHLDTFEGFQSGREAMLNAYNRVQINARRADGLLSCMTYEAAHAPDPGLTSRHYLGQLLSGARHHGLPADNIEWLAAFAVLDAEPVYPA